MPGLTDLDALLRKMKPTLNDGDFVFCTLSKLETVLESDILMMFKEAEGTTVIVKKEIADSLQLDYSFIASWITLEVHSSLQAVGLTATFSMALSEGGISCNVVAGYFHDHIFVDKKDAVSAIDILKEFSG